MAVEPESPHALAEEFMREHHSRHERLQELEQVIFNLLLARSESLVKRFRKLGEQTPPAENTNSNP